MRRHHLLFVVGLIISLTSLDIAIGNEKLVNNLCEEATQDDNDLTAEECKKKLLAIPEDERGDPHNLGASTLKMIFRGIYEAWEYVQQLLREGKLDQHQQNLLSSRCLDNYRGAIDDMKIALGQFRDKSYNSVDVRIADAVEQATKCEESFEQENLKSPLADRFREIRKLSEIAIDLEIILGN